MFCDGDHSKLVPEYTQPGGFPSWTIVNNITKNLKSEHLLLEQKVMPVTEAPMWYLTPTPLVFGKWGRVLLQDPKAVPPVLAFI